MGIGYDSDQEYDSHSDSSVEYFSESEIEQRRPILYDIDTMYKIIRLRDFHGWNLSTIHQKYKRISETPTGRGQISR